MKAFAVIKVSHSVAKNFDMAKLNRVFRKEQFPLRVELLGSDDPQNDYFELIKTDSPSYQVMTIETVTRGGLYRNRF